MMIIALLEVPYELPALYVSVMKVEKLLAVAEQALVCTLLCSRSRNLLLVIEALGCETSLRPFVTVQLQ